MKRGSDQKPATILDKAGSRISSRQVAMFLVCAVLLGALALRLFYLQVVKNKYYEDKVIEQMIYQTPITASRGDITDRNGRVLATTYKTERVYFSPSDIKSDEERESACRYLSEKLSLDYNALYSKAKKTTQKDVTVKAGVEPDVARDIRAYALENGLSHFVHTVEQSSRVYPYSTTAAAVIGFCGTDGGLYGLEYQYNDILSGKSGMLISAVRPDGEQMPYRYESYIDAENGANIVTTIDYYVQSALEKYLEQAAIEAGCQDRACAVAMDPKTGEILGFAVYPSFDLNDPYTVVDYYADALSEIGAQYGEDSAEYIAAYRAYQLEQWNNKALSETYEPGSTSKIFTTSMALEENLSNPSELFSCTGSYTVSGWNIRCHKKGGHGTLTFAEGLQNSCNPVMMKLSQRIGAETFYKYFEGFGLTSKTGVDLPGEADTIIKDKDDIKELDLAVYSFGQRYNVTTLSQLTSVSAVANNGMLVTPHLIKSIVDDDGNVLYEYKTKNVRQVISEETAKTISQILADGVSGNGGAKNARVEGYSVAAKTGTSEKGTVGNKRIVSTVAFAPSDDAKISVIMMIDEPTRGLIYGSQLVAPYISTFLSDVLPYLDVEPSFPEGDTRAQNIEVQNYRGLSADAATAKLKEMGIKYELVGGGQSVIDQVPVSGAKISKDGGKIILYTEKIPQSEYVTVPDVIGKSAEQANIMLTQAGLNVVIAGRHGEGTTVARQSVQSGESVPRGTPVEITMLYREDED